MLLNIIGPLHFGNFAGLLSKAIWVALGFASCYVIVSGLTLGLRRRLPGTAWGWYERFVHVLAIGLPISLVASAMTYFVYRASPVVVTATPLSFVAASVVLCILVPFLPARRVEAVLWCVLSLSLFALPVVRIVTGGPGWIDALQGGVWIVVAMDLVVLAAGVVCAWQVPGRLGFRSAETAAA